jgi:hypothetical protein
MRQGSSDSYDSDEQDDEEDGGNEMYMHEQQQKQRHHQQQFGPQGGFPGPSPMTGSPRTENLSEEEAQQQIRCECIFPKP